MSIGARSSTAHSSGGTFGAQIRSKRCALAASTPIAATQSGSTDSISATIASSDSSSGAFEATFSSTARSPEAIRSLPAGSTDE